MQVLQLRLKLVIEWIINKKQSIYDLVVNHLPIFRAIKQFMQAYVHHMNEIVQIIQKNMKQLSKNIGNDDSIKTVIQLLDLVRQKQLINIQQWKQKLEVLQSRYKNNNGESRPFPDIFQSIDMNIQYYNSLRQKLKLARIKVEQKNFQTTNYQKIIENNDRQKYRMLQFQRDPVKQNDRQRQRLRQRQIFRQKQIQKLKGGNVFKKYAQIVDKYDNNLRKTDMYANIYDKEYGQNNKNRENMKKNKEQSLKQVKLQKVDNYNSTRNTQYSPYKLVNPKYNTPKQDAGYYSQKQRPLSNRLKSEPNFNYLSSADRAQKYKQFKTQLYQEMLLTQQRPRYTADKYMSNNDSPIKKFNTNFTYQQDPKDYQTAYSDRYGTNSTKNRENQIKGRYGSDRKPQNYYSEQINNQQQKKQGTGVKKKYKYLFEDESNPALKDFYKQPPIIRQQKNKYASQRPKDPFQNINLPTQKKSYKYHYQNYLKNQLNQQKKKTVVNNDSLDMMDPLGSELQVDMPILFKQGQNNNLQHILTDSLLSSKKWQGSEVIEYLPELQDSLDNADMGIRQTGKFKEIKYTDEDQDQEQEVQNRYNSNRLNPYDKQLTIEKQVSSESRELNMSFGRN